MTTTVDTASAPAAPPVRGRTGLRGGWIEHREPEDAAFGSRPAGASPTRNLIASIFAEHLGFAIWVIWTIVVINLGNIGISRSVPELFWLTAVPNLIGSALRLPRLPGRRRPAPAPARGGTHAAAALLAGGLQRGAGDGNGRCRPGVAGRPRCHRAAR